MSEMNQASIWEHFQNEGEASFSQSRPRLDYIFSRAKAGGNSLEMTILNIGAGNGYFELRSKKEFKEVYSLDLSEKTVKRLQEKGINAVLGDISQMPFENGMFDRVVASEVLEHLSEEQRENGLNEIKRVLKQDGKFIGTVPFNENLMDNHVVCPSCNHQFHRWGHLKSFKNEEIEALLKSRFSVKEVKTLAFVEFSNRSLIGKLKSLVRWILGKLGSPISSPNIYFEVSKKE